MRLTDRVGVVGGGGLGYGLTSLYDCNVYVLDGGGTFALIDAGSGIEPERLLVQLAADGIAPERVALLLLTHGHADHAGGAAALRERLGGGRLEIAAPAATAAMVESADEEATSLAAARAAGTYPDWYRLRPCPVDRIVRPRGTIAVGDLTLAVVGAPGHSSDMVCYYCPELKALFAADAVFEGGRLAVIDTPDFSMDDYRETIEALARLDVGRLFPGHGRALTTGGGEPIAAARERFRQSLPPLSIV
ncbi:MBL fold metallo-hydrolase [Paenibacillus flagellatus]|uniref:beta-lactamase n=1 Tax=Paenibacillus flagellatus TaxID=2211139 RepID=A0A2V5KRA9_9BACL|nr:MBL fold metallo-hydrolase [Paenibacillus flagellatus]PYI53957.1 hypothetical protein DLM86_15505 [Paenibacillus flagellatus]